MPTAIDAVNRNHLTTMVQETRDSDSPLYSNISSVEQSDATLTQFIENPHDTHSAKKLYDKIACWDLPPDICQANFSKGTQNVVNLLGAIYKDVDQTDKRAIDQICTTLKNAKGDEKKEKKVIGNIIKLLTTHQELLMKNTFGSFSKHCEEAWAYHHSGYDQTTRAEMKFHKDALACEQLVKNKIRDLIAPDCSWTSMKIHAENFKQGVIALSKTLRHHEGQAKQPDEALPPKGERKSQKRHNRSVPTTHPEGMEEGLKGINIVVNGSKAKASSNVPNISNSEPQSNIKHLTDLAGKLLESKLDNEQIDKKFDILLDLIRQNSSNWEGGIVHRLHSVTPVNLAETPPLESRGGKATGLEQTTNMPPLPQPATARFLPRRQQSDDEGYESHVSSGMQDFTRYAEDTRRDKVLTDFTPEEVSVDTVASLPLENRNGKSTGIEQNTGIEQSSRTLSQTAVAREVPGSQRSDGGVHNRFITRLNVNVQQRAEKTGQEQSSVDHMSDMTSVNTEDAFSFESTDGKAIGLEQTTGIPQSIRSFSQSVTARLLQQQGQPSDPDGDVYESIVSANWGGPSSVPHYAERTVHEKVFAELRPGVTSVDTVDASIPENSDGKAVGMEQNGIQPSIRPFSRRTTARILQQSQQPGNAGDLVMAELKQVLENRGGRLYDNPETTNEFAVVNDGAMRSRESVSARNTERSTSVSSSRWGPERQSSLEYTTAKKPKSHS